MRAPQPGAPGPRGLVHGLVLGLVALLVATLIGPAQSTAAGDERPPPAPGSTAPRVVAQDRADDDTRDMPTLPAKCFGPGRSRIEPFPCPLNQQKKGQPVIILWGDSHAYEWIPGLVEAVKGQKVNLVSMVAGSCPPVLVTTDPGAYQCRRSNWIAYKYVRQLIREKARFKVILGSNWSGFRRGYRSMVLEEVGGPPTGYVTYTQEMVKMAHEGTPALFDKLAALHVDVDIIAQAATVPARRPLCAAGDDPYNCDLQRWRAMPEEASTRAYLKAQQAKIRRHGRSEIIDASPGYCDASVCHGKIGTIETYFDDLHLSATRTRTLARYFVPAVRAVRR